MQNHNMFTVNKLLKQRFSQTTHNQLITDKNKTDFFAREKIEKN